MFRPKNITIPLSLMILLSACTKEIAGDVKLTDFQTIPSQILVCAETHSNTAKCSKQPLNTN